MQQRQKGSEESHLSASILTESHHFVRHFEFFSYYRPEDRKEDVLS